MERAVERSWADIEVVRSRATVIWVERFMLHLRGYCKVRRLVLSAITRLRQRHREIIRNVNRLGFLILAITLASGQREAPQGSQQGDCGTQAIVVNARDKQGQFPPSL